MPQGTSYSQWEELEIIKAYLQASENNIKGAQMKFEDFKANVFTILQPILEANPSVEMRNPSAYFRRAKLISLEVGRFSNFHHQVLAKRVSGHSADDQLQDTCRMYQEYLHEEVEKSKRATARKNGTQLPSPEPFTGTSPFSFRYMACWELMRHYPKWKVRSSRAACEESPDFTTHLSTPEARPKGRDASKRIKRGEDFQRSTELRLDESNKLKAESNQNARLGLEVAMAAAGLLPEDHLKALTDELYKIRFKQLEDAALTDTPSHAPSKDSRTTASSSTSDVLSNAGSIELLSDFESIEDLSDDAGNVITLKSDSPTLSLISLPVTSPSDASTVRRSDGITEPKILAYDTQTRDNDDEMRGDDQDNEEMDSESTHIDSPEKSQDTDLTQLNPADLLSRHDSISAETVSDMMLYKWDLLKTSLTFPDIEKKYFAIKGGLIRLRQGMYDEFQRQVGRYCLLPDAIDRRSDATYVHLEDVASSFKNYQAQIVSAPWKKADIFLVMVKSGPMMGYRVKLSSDAFLHILCGIVSWYEKRDDYFEVNGIWVFKKDCERVSQ
jgi:hypothetical protein